MHLSKNMTKTKRTKTLQIAHKLNNNPILYTSLFCSSVLQYVALCARCVSIAGKKTWLQESLHSCYCPDRIEFRLAGPSCEQLFTHRRERRRLMPSGLAEKQTLRRAIMETLLLPSFPSCMMWRSNSSAKTWRLFFSPLIIAWESQVFFFLFSFTVLSVIVRESHYYLWQLHSIHSLWQGQRQMKCSDYLGFILQYL